MIIKFLLIGAAVWLGVLVLRERVPGQHLALRRLLGVLVAGLAIVAVLWPDLTVVAANAVGVQRGTDLVLYLLVVVFIYNAIASSQRAHRMEQQIIVLTRELALRDRREQGADERDARPVPGEHA
jgi:hypothetical protein